MSLLIYAGISLIFLGFILIVIGSIGSFLGDIFGKGNLKTDEPGTDGSKTHVRGGGIIMIGPVPIILGSDRGSLKTLIMLAIVLITIYFVFSSCYPSC
ncbi:MAG: DUF131 domain-containing protein [Methanolobus sp.]|uniref:TIGR00304 family membrane protein n=1 Tax=Methanolobus sp. TaxID=1874737 RepID=UPI00272F7980|nr:DUF131 domain-containing protein [Methanolobus sp.]MDP2218180.1 DUF131 domain-containing protein [Methanolobus sp.]